MQRICLVVPPSQFLIDSRVFPSLGILKIGAVLKQAGYTVDCLDLSGVTNYEEVVDDYAHDATFAVTSTTPQYPSAIRIRNAIKAKNYDAKVILGGPHVTMTNAGKKKSERAQLALDQMLKIFDCVVAGEGEKAIFTALHTRGLVDADDPKSILWNTSQDFTNSPWPDRDLIDISSYHFEIQGHRAMSLVHQLGCPMGCQFCGGRNSPTFRQIRLRSSSNAVDEMMHLHDKYGIDAIMAMDDELNVNRQMVTLMREIQATGVDWRMRGFVKAELFTEEQAQAMYAAGFRQLLCGFESAHPRILKNIRKNATVEDNTAMLRTARKHGITVKALMSFGHPGESEETILATRDWLLKEKPTEFDCTVMTLYPGTGYYDDSKCIDDPLYVYETNGDKLYSEDVDFSKEQAYYKGMSGAYKAFVWTDHLTRERLAELRDEVEDEVRRKLGIPYPTSVAELNYGHSMGQSLPQHILRTTDASV